MEKVVDPRNPDITRFYINDSEFYEMFNVTPNDHEDRFETYGTEYDELLKILEETPERVWTAVDTEDRAGIGFMSGFHFVNRQYYIVTDEAVPKNVSYDVKVIWDGEDDEGEFNESE